MGVSGAPAIQFLIFFIKTIAIVGAGPGGFRLVANLGLAGYRLRLNDIDDSKLTAIRVPAAVD